MTLPPLPEPTRYRKTGWGSLQGEFTESDMHAYGAACAAAERERCAKLIETTQTNGDHLGGWLELIAAAIRAQGIGPQP